MVVVGGICFFWVCCCCCCFVVVAIVILVGAVVICFIDTHVGDENSGPRNAFDLVTALLALLLLLSPTVTSADVGNESA